MRLPNSPLRSSASHCRAARSGPENVRQFYYLVAPDSSTTIYTFSVPYLTNPDSKPQFCVGHLKSVIKNVITLNFSQLLLLANSASLEPPFSKAVRAFRTDFSTLDSHLVQSSSNFGTSSEIDKRWRCSLLTTIMSCWIRCSASWMNWVDRLCL